MKRSQQNTGFNLKAYSALAVIALGADTAYSQIVYTDIDPDITLEGELEVDFIDLNDDGIDDFAIYRFSIGIGFADMLIPNPSAGASIGGTITSGSSSYIMAFALDAGEDINEGINWMPAASSAFGILASSNVIAPGEHGEWVEATDKYAALRLDMGDHFIYGWVRMDVGEAGTPITIKDMAYNSTPDEHICAGDGYGAPDCSNAVSATAVTAVADIADNENGLDLECTFNPVGAEDDIEAYHVIAVKTSASAAFDVTAAAALGTDSYISVTPTGLEMYTVNFNATSKDSEGDAVVNDQPYHVFVLSVAAAPYENALSAPSAEITLITEEDTTLLVTDLQQFISVYPNPVHGSEMLTAEIKNISAGEVIFEITDITGNKTGKPYSTFDNTIAMDISKLPAGVYFLKSTLNHVTHVIQFVKD